LNRQIGIKKDLSEIKELIPASATSASFYKKDGNTGGRSRTGV